MKNILDFIKPKHRLEDYLTTLEEMGEVDISRLDLRERLRLVRMVREKGYTLDYRYPDPRTHDKVVLVIKNGKGKNADKV